MSKTSSSMRPDAANTTLCCGAGPTDSDTWGIAFNSPTSRFVRDSARSFLTATMDDESIRITSIRELTPEEEEDLLIRFGKKEPEIEHTPAPQEVEGAEVEELDTAASE